MLKIKRNPNLLVISKNESLYVSLEKVSIEATIRSLTADVTIIQVFRNNYDTLIDAIYYSPLQKQETIHTFIAHMEDREVCGIDLLKQNNHTIDVGTLLPSKECTITIGYTTKLSFIDESTIQLIIPTNVSSLANKYMMEFNCSIEGMNELERQSQIIEVGSPSHPVQVHCLKQNIYMVTFIQENTSENRNILIDIKLADTLVTPDSIKVHLDDVHNIITTNTIGQPFDYYCVLDFEAVCHQVDPNLKRPSPNDTWEIIEFPICLLESQSNSIIDTFHSYVRPIIKTTLNETCINITGITQDIVDQSPTFDIVWNDVQRFLAKHSLISFENSPSNLYSFTWITCGNWDLRTMLPLQLKQSGLDQPIFINNFINLKDLYNEYYPSARIRGMKDMLKKSNLKLDGRHHSGIDDTKNIAKIAQWLIQNNKILKLTYKHQI